MCRILSRLMSVLVLTFVLCSPVFVCAEAQANAGGHHGEAHEEGLPMAFTPDLALFSLITFGVFLAALRFGAWGPLQAGLNERERGIKQNIADTEANFLKSEAMVKEHELKLAKVQEEVRDILAEARRDAEHTKQEIIAVAQKESDATKHRAIAEIERSRDLAISELFDYVSANVIGATEKVIGRHLTGEDHDRIVKEALAELNVRRN